MRDIRQATIKLALANPELRQYLIPLLRKTAMDFDTPEDMKEYLDEHPDADKSLHHVKPTTKPTSNKPENKSENKSENKPTDKAKNWLSKIKDKYTKTKASIMESVEKAPETVHKFVLDADYRKEKMSKAVSDFKQTPKKLFDTAISSAKSKVKELKQAGFAMKKLVKGEKPDKEELRALYSTAFFVAGTVIGGVAGGSIMGATSFGNSFASHIGNKVISNLVKTAIETTGKGLVTGMGLVASAKMTDEQYQELLVKNIVAGVLKELENISEADMKKIMAGVEAST
jgi:hypothetical protein